MAKVCRIRMKSDERREQLVGAGVELLGRRPYGELSIEEIATAAGISKGLLYHYFSGKREFVLAVLAAATDQIGADIAPDASLSPAERFEHGLDAYLDFAERHAAGFAALMNAAAATDEEVRAILARGRERTTGFVLAVVDPRGAERSPVLEAAVHGWLHFVEGAVARWLERRDMERSQLRELLRQALIDGLRSAERLDPGLSLDLARLDRAPAAA